MQIALAYRILRDEDFSGWTPHPLSGERRTPRDIPKRDGIFMLSLASLTKQCRNAVTTTPAIQSQPGLNRVR